MRYSFLGMRRYYPFIWLLYRHPLLSIVLIDFLPKEKEVEMARKKSAKKPTSAGTSYELSGNVDHGSVAVLGPNAKVTVTQQTGAQIVELTAMFDAVFKKIETLPADPNVDKEEIVETVQKIQTEASKEDQANTNKLERWMTNIAQMAPDILEVMAASLAGPVSGFTAVFKKIVDSFKD